MLRISPLFPLSYCAIAFVTGASAAQAKAPAPLRTLIVSGGPQVKFNQYAIESNARYVEGLTTGSKSQRVLFADGNRDSRTISAFEADPDEKEKTIVAVMLQEKMTPDKQVQNATTLKRLDGPSTPENILKEVQALAASAQPGEQGLIYFTGHGSPGNDGNGRPDTDNTNYNAWGKDLSMRELAPALQSWPQNVPLTLVMVQCYGGGFSNLMFQGGDPKNGIWPREFCGFFATSGDRMAAGCTNEVNERDYQDFTTHFFAALSGISRDGDAIKMQDADFDKDGAVSGLEALAYTDLHDDSIDVPICTSDMYLRSLWANEDTWRQTPYSTLLQNADGWEKAVLTGLSTEFNFTGEGQIQDAFTAHDALVNRMQEANKTGKYDDMGLVKIDGNAFMTQFGTIKSDVMQRFPVLQTKDSPDYAKAKEQAIAYLKTQPTQVQSLYDNIMSTAHVVNLAQTREAKLWRFIRMARTITLQKRLQTEGTPDQKAIFARLRANETRNFLKS